MIPFNNGEELQTYEHRYVGAVKVYIPPYVVFVRSPKGTRSSVGLGVSINTTCHISLTTCSALNNFGKNLNWESMFQGYQKRIATSSRCFTSREKLISFFFLDNYFLCFWNSYPFWYFLQFSLYYRRWSIIKPVSFARATNNLILLVFSATN